MNLSVNHIIKKIGRIAKKQKGLAVPFLQPLEIKEKLIEKTEILDP
jgi:hypothetical protein